MPGLLIIAHAPLASALKAVAAHVDADCGSRVGAVDVQPDWSPERLELEARREMERVRDPQVLILSDVQGATPCNVVLKLADGADVRAVAGVNVPMVWRALCYSREPLDVLAEKAVGGGIQGVMSLSPTRPQHQSLNSRRHDQDHAHHQQ